MGFDLKIMCFFLYYYLNLRYYINKTCIYIILYITIFFEKNIIVFLNEYVFEETLKIMNRLY